MIFVNSVTAAMFTLLSSHSVIVSSAFTVQEGEALNQEITHTPWVGIYYGDMTIAPHTVGGATPWQAELELFLYVQEGSHRSGGEATRLLAMAQSEVLNALNEDKTIGETVLMLTGMTVSPFQRDLKEDTWLFTNEIALKAELRG